MSPSEKFLAGTTPLSGGIARCDECGEILLEDERHWHDSTGSDTPEPATLKRTRFVEITEEWIEDCREPPGCKNALPSLPCCGEGHWQQIQ